MVGKAMRLKKVLSCWQRVVLARRHLMFTNGVCREIRHKWLALETGRNQKCFPILEIDTFTQGFG
jgi:hypothetical protein